MSAVEGLEHFVVVLTSVHPSSSARSATSVLNGNVRVLVKTLTIEVVDESRVAADGARYADCR